MAYIKNGQVYPSKEWYDANINPTTGKSFAEEKRETQTKQEKPLVAGSVEGAKELKVQELAGPPVDISQAKSAYSGSRAMVEQAQKESEERQRQIAEQQKIMAEQVKQKKSSILEQFGLSSKPKEELAWQETGISPTESFTKQKKDIAEIGALMTDYDNLVSKKDEAIAIIESDPLVQAGAESRKINTEKQYNLQLSQKATNINTRLAIMEMENKNFDRAQAFVQQAVQNYTYEKKLAVDELNNFINQNNDIIKEMSDEDQSIFSNALSSAKLEYDNEKEKASQIGELVLENPMFLPDFNASYEDNLIRFQNAGGTTLGMKPIEVSPGATLYDPITGKAIFTAPKITGGGVNVKSQDLQATQAKMQSVIDDLKTYTINNPKMTWARKLPFVGTAIGAGKRYYQTKTGLSDEWKNYMKWRDGIATTISKSLGNIGTPSDRDVQRIVNFFPAYTDTKEQATEAVARIEKTLSDMQQVMIDFYNKTGTKYNGTVDADLLDIKGDIIEAEVVDNLLDKQQENVQRMQVGNDIYILQPNGKYIKQ
jgi:hypothetical protein